MYVWTIWLRLIATILATWLGTTGVGVLVWSIREPSLPGIVVAIGRLIQAAGFLVIQWYEGAGAAVVVVGLVMPRLLLRPWLLGRHLRPDVDVL